MCRPIHGRRRAWGSGIEDGFLRLTRRLGNAERGGRVPVGKLYFAPVSGLELGLICLLAPAFTADLVSDERERRTLDLLLVSPWLLFAALHVLAIGLLFWLTARALHRA